MNRIDKVLTDLKNSNKKMLSPYITAGDPEPQSTIELMHRLVQSGANILEIGVPFSDPMAEGPVIQHAMERALAHRVSLPDVLKMISMFRQSDLDTPIVLMGYLNPIEQYGYETFAADAKKAGIDGTIIVDLPPEESSELHATWLKYNLYSIFLCSPTTTPQRMQLINQFAQGYLYYVSLKGVTGSNILDLQSLEKHYLNLKEQTNLPLMVGFGIKTPEIAAQVAKFADGVIIGAALITTIIEYYNEKRDFLKAAMDFMSSVRQALDSN